VREVIQYCTTDYYDETGDCQYQGSRYHHFHHTCLILLLTLSQAILSGQAIDTAYRNLHDSIEKRVHHIGPFPSHVSEEEMISFLEDQIDWFFDALFDLIER